MELAQLKTLPFVTGDGWAVVHSVYRGGQPDGWSVIYPLAGNKPEPKLKGAVVVFKPAEVRWTADQSLEVALEKKTRLERILRKAADVRRALQVPRIDPTGRTSIAGVIDGGSLYSNVGARWRGVDVMVPRRCDPV